MTEPGGLTSEGLNAAALETYRAWCHDSEAQWANDAQREAWVSVAERTVAAYASTLATLPGDLPEPAEPLEGAVAVDWQRPLDEWETAFKDELFYWGPFFRGLGHGHMYLDANAKYALARIAGVLHRAAVPGDKELREALQVCVNELIGACVNDGWPHLERCGCSKHTALAKAKAALGSALEGGDGG